MEFLVPGKNAFPLNVRFGATDFDLMAVAGF